MYLKIVFKVGEENHTVIIDEEEDGKKILREKLKVKRLPNGVEKISVSPVPYEEISTDDLNRFLVNEKQRFIKLSNFNEKYPDMGTGWKNAAIFCKQNIDKIEQTISQQG